MALTVKNIEQIINGKSWNRVEHNRDQHQQGNDDFCSEATL